MFGKKIIPILIFLLLLCLNITNYSVGTPQDEVLDDETNQEKLEIFTNVLTSDYVFSKELGLILQSADGLRTEHDVIIRFKTKIDSAEIEELNRLGIQIRYRFRVLDAISTTTTGSNLMKLSRTGLVKYIEQNLPMIRDMDMSLSVVNSTKAWDSQVIRNGIELDHIDGTGVTVCVVDTGIDAGHPDLDYGRKTLFNMHDIGGGNWIEMENSDVNYGHGTHVAGTVAGNGDASAGSRSGVAPGANLIGLSVSIPEQMTTPTVETYIQGLEWVYEHSKPNNNPYNIRCATNSWHSSVGEYAPEQVITIMIEKLAFENNVVTTWSAGNDGRDDPEGETITTSQQGNTPVGIMVAAYERDGSAVTDFSSRGKVGWNHTYPDLGAPGRSIWSCSARRTIISSGTYIGGNTNPYYLAISGTSMSTPHIAGTVALLWQAAPSMRISYIHEDYSGDDPSWWNNSRTYVHDVELILEASCKYLSPTEEHGVLVGSKSTLPGWNEKLTDYVQGYGIVDVHRAVGIALALEELRNKYPDENITVFDAIMNYDKVALKKDIVKKTNVLSTSWSGEFSRFQTNLGDALSSVNQTKKIYIPQGARTVNVDLYFSAVNSEELEAADLAITIDYGDDGSVDYRGSLSLTSGGTKNYEFDASGNSGMIWTLDMIGQGIKIPNPIKKKNYVEMRVDYDIRVNVYFDTTVDTNYTRNSPIFSELVFSSDFAPTGSFHINKTAYIYDLSNVELIRGPKKPEQDQAGVESYWYCLLGVIIAIPVVLYLYKKFKNR